MVAINTSSNITANDRAMVAINTTKNECFR